MDKSNFLRTNVVDFSKRRVYLGMRLSLEHRDELINFLGTNVDCFA